MYEIMFAMKKHLSAAFFILSLFFLHTSVALAEISVSELNSLSNNERASNSLGALSTSEALTRSAQMKADDMASKSYFEHMSPEGKNFFYWIDQAGYSYSMAGENLAIYFAESEDVVEAWMNSPTHRENILRQGFSQVGTALAEGSYQGQKTFYVVQHYGSPKEVPQVSTIPAIEQPSPVIKTSIVASTRRSVETTKPLEVVKTVEIKGVEIVSAHTEVEESVEKIPEKTVTISKWRTLLHGFISWIKKDLLSL